MFDDAKRYFKDEEFRQRWLMLMLTRIGKIIAVMMSLAVVGAIFYWISLVGGELAVIIVLFVTLGLGLIAMLTYDDVKAEYRWSSRFKKD